ncbi:hypothetical protein AB1Y20_020376 [Prymnesium parvum]|uniref:Radial spoke protein 8 n=1 Tax=Prymnesium parvum TaxID=97485 RepID=A0AB34JXY2_PRYPA|mmetsp:Transcript_33202/g.82687  ORF Transcript_33202/g.82687 Transcript_33202/m.82687 type:complete len:393 (-) Transcript_33202:272-1450(-)
MHAVIRKRQGLPWEKEVSQGFSKNSTHLIQVAAIPNFEPMAEDTLTLAHGVLAYPKLVREINSPLLTLKQKALNKMLEMTVASRHIASFLAVGCVAALNTAARDSDSEVKGMATNALARIAREDKGRQELVAQQSVGVLLQCAADESAQVRLAAFEAVSWLAVTHEGMRACYEAGFVKVTVDRCTEEGGESEAQVQLAALVALHALSKNNPGARAAIDCGAIEMCVKVLEHGTDAMCEQAGYCLTALTFDQLNKSTALASDIMDPLILLLRSNKSLAVKMAAASALMSMTNGIRFEDGSNACKKAAIDAGAVGALVPLLQEGLAHERAGTMSHKTSALTVYVTKCIANLADLVIGRKQLQACLKDLDILSKSNEPLVRKHATIAVERVKWQP